MLQKKSYLAYLVPAYLELWNVRIHWFRIVIALNKFWIVGIRCIQSWPLLSHLHNIRAQSNMWDIFAKTNQFHCAEGAKHQSAKHSMNYVCLPLDWRENKDVIQLEFEWNIFKRINTAVDSLTNCTLIRVSSNKSSILILSFIYLLEGIAHQFEYITFFRVSTKENFSDKGPSQKTTLTTLDFVHFWLGGRPHDSNY